MIEQGRVFYGNPVGSQHDEFPFYFIEKDPTIDENKFFATARRHFQSYILPKLMPKISEDLLPTYGSTDLFFHGEKEYFLFAHSGFSKKYMTIRTHPCLIVF
jgi:hypothetical protein